MPSKAAQEVSSSAIKKNKGGQLNVSDCRELNAHIEQILEIKDHKLAKGKVGNEGYRDTDGEIRPRGLGKTRQIVDAKKFEDLVERDLTIFLGNTIKTTNTPHGLDRLRQTVEQLERNGTLNEPHPTLLKQQITKQYTRQLQSFPDYLAQLAAQDDSPEAQHVLAREKLEAIHEMTVAVQKHSPETLKKFHHQLKVDALKCFTECAEHTKPHSTDLSATQDRLKRIEYEKTELLKPILVQTSTGVEGRLSQADTSSQASRAALQAQLDEIPRLEVSMQEMVKTSIELAKQTKKLKDTHEARARELEPVVTELTNRKQKAGRWRRINPAYQRFRNANIKKQSRLRNEIKTIQSDTTQKRQKYTELQTRFAHEKQQLQGKKEQYGTSVSVLQPTRPLTEGSFDIKPFTSKITSDSLTALDEACLHYHLSRLSEKNASSEQLKTLAEEYVNQIHNGDTSPLDIFASQLNQALIINKPVVDSEPDIEWEEDEWDDDDIDTSSSTPETMLTTEQLAELTKIGTDQTPLLSDEDFTESISKKLKDSTNPKVTEEQKKELTELLVSTYTNPDLPKAGVQALADRLVEIQNYKYDLVGYVLDEDSSPESDNKEVVCWQYEDLMTGFNKGIEALRQGSDTGEALDAMDHSFSTDSIHSDTDSAYGESPEALSDFATESLAHIYHLKSRPLTTEQYIKLEDQLDELYQNHPEKTILCDNLVHHLSKLYTSTTGEQPPEHSFETISSALTAGITVINEGKEYSEAEAAFDQVLKDAEPIQSTTNPYG